MPDLALPWGDGKLEVSLPETWTLQQVATAELRSVGKDWPDRIAAALNQPCAGETLGKLLTARKNGRIVIVVEDLTRHSPLPEILELVMRETRHAGVADKQIEIFLATGMHPPMTQEEVASKLGRFAEFKWRCNPWHDEHAYTHIGQVDQLPVEIDRGVATADLRIVVSSVSPHLQAGFGGGYKMFLPGCASMETIRGLHRLGLGRKSRQLVGLDAKSNPMRAAIDAAGKLVDANAGKTFAVQYILDDHNLPSATATGEMLPAQQMLAKQCSVMCGVMCSSPADIVIANAYPRDTDLWQSFKCIPNTLWAARPNGVIIALARCADGLGGMDVPKKWPVSPKWTRRILRFIGGDSLFSLLTRLMPHLAGDAAFFVRMAIQTLHRNHVLLVSPALAEAGAKFPGIHLLANVEDAVALTQEILGDGQHRVTVFPSGGITYPVLTTGPAATIAATETPITPVTKITKTTKAAKNPK